MKNIVTKQQIDELLAKSVIKVETVYDKVTVVNCKLPNGFVITEASGAVDPANYDEEIGKDVDEVEDDFDEENEEHEKTETPAAPTETEEETKDDYAKMFAAIAERLDRIEAALGESMRNPKEADKKASEELTALERKYAF